MIGERGGPFRRARARCAERRRLVDHRAARVSGIRDARKSARRKSTRRRDIWKRFAHGSGGGRRTTRASITRSNCLPPRTTTSAVDWACDLFFQAEREYWQSRNRAGRVQYERQNRLGLGWANHDHHTYRSSRDAFPQLIATLEQMGFQCRERFYAGREAGWGAQVLEQPRARVVIFADVDLSPEEVAGDFAHQPLGECELGLGTVGLWCELHGEAFLEAGMHHLECQFDFDAARAQLAAVGIETMAPFTDFPYLKQAFTKGEMWPVDPRRIERLLADGRITAEQAIRFRREGALGSHLEILERNDGYKGFNQTGISEIITRTDPRRMIGA